MKRTGGKYGNVLLCFAEQLQTVTAFKMRPLVDSGYGPEEGVRKSSGVLQCKAGRRTEIVNGNLVRTRDMEYWTADVLEVGSFVRDGDGIVYRVKGDNEWRREAGFTVYTLRMLVGADGDEVPLATDQGAVGTGDFA